MKTISELEEEKIDLERRIHDLKGPMVDICTYCYKEMKDHSRPIFYGCGITMPIYLSEWAKGANEKYPNRYTRNSL